MRRFQYFLIGWKGKVWVNRNDKHFQEKRTSNGMNAPPHAIACFPVHDNDIYGFELFFDDKYLWCREIDPFEYEELMAWKMFPVEAWTKFCERGPWYDTVHAHARETWEVLPDIPNVRNYRWLDMDFGERRRSGEEEFYAKVA